MLTIYRKDIHSYFTTFTGYLFIACILLVGGIYCYINNFFYGYSAFENAISYLPFFFVFLIPVIYGTKIISYVITCKNIINILSMICLLPASFCGWRVFLNFAGGFFKTGTDVYSYNHNAACRCCRVPVAEGGSRTPLRRRHKIHGVVPLVRARTFSRHE